ncbi:MAG: hypothetical protein NC408_05790 [Candidatus Gastranaerophilales bacterium]|nr:hypothetical protein [Candidatus Gastranaerophilales bacterium]MCM1073576.1 hypothetical protein [Bacteroides sp.]
MKKKFLMLLSILVLSSTINFAYAKSTTNSELAYAIKLYKAGNYTECYARLNEVVKKDSSNAVAYYYLGMTSAHMGKKDDAISNYERAVSLTTPGNSIYAYAEKGKRCLEDPEKCQEPTFESALDEFIQSTKRQKVSDQVQGDYEKLQIDQLKRDMNRDENIDPRKFKEFKDFSSMNNETPTNDEIVAALRTLQKAGLSNVYGSDLSFYSGNNNQAQMFNMLGTSGMSPQMIQAMLTNNMSLGF